MTPADRTAHDRLWAELAMEGRTEFPLQLLVDAWAAQHADPDTKPIRLTFALIGLSLRCEHGYTGRAVQDVHIRLGRRRHPWPSFPLPDHRGHLTVHDVLAVPPGPDRLEALDRWCRSVWEAYAPVHREVAGLLAEHGIV